MGYPGAYQPVISVAASGWTGEWTPNSAWWRAKDVADPTVASDFYITDFSSRQLPGQDLDLSAPGSWVVGPYQVNGQLSYFFLGGTSMASPHAAGVAALIWSVAPTATAADPAWWVASSRWHWRSASPGSSPQADRTRALASRTERIIRQAPVTVLDTPAGPLRNRARPRATGRIAVAPDNHCQKAH